MHRVAVVALLFVPAVSAAQPERYELGRRLRMFEVEWEKQSDSARRTAALKVLPQATTQFFALKLGEAGKTLDTARFTLLADDTPAAERWLASLCILPEKRLVDAATADLSVTVKHFYPPAEKTPPAGIKAVLRLGTGDAVPVPLDKLPATIRVPLPAGGWAGDWQLKLEVGEQAEIAVGVSVIRDMAKSLAAIDVKSLEKEIGKPLAATVEVATLRDRFETLSDLADGQSPETDLPAGRMLMEAWFLRFTLLGGMMYHRLSPWEQRIVVPVGKQRVSCRIWVPKSHAPTPVVVALHGAGVSENMWFESYGAGHIVTECAKRGWTLVAPRCGFGGAPPVSAILDELGKRYDIDRKRVFLIGHSMGAGNAVSLATANPGAYRGVAALGGGGRADAKAFEKTPLFVGVGSADFALAGARSLAKTVPRATLKEYPDVEHLVIVRVALPDAFAVFDAAAKP